MFFRVVLKAALLQKLIKQKADGSKRAGQGVLWSEKIQSLREPRESGIYCLYNTVQKTSTESWLSAGTCLFSDSNFSIEIMEHRIGEGYLIRISVYSFLNVDMS